MSSRTKGRIVGVTLFAFIVFAIAMLWIPQGPALPPGLTLAQSSGGNRSSSSGGGSAFPVTVTGGVSGAVPCFTSTTVESAGTLLTANSPVLGGGAGVCPSTATFLTTDGAATLTVGVVGGGNGVLALGGNTSGTATFTSPATAGTRTNQVTMSNALTGPAGAAGTPTYGLASGAGMYGDGAGSVLFSTGSTFGETFTVGGGHIQAQYVSNAVLAWGAGTASPLTVDTALSRPAPGIVQVGTSASSPNANGLLLSGNKAFVTTDFTDANSAALQAITGLSFGLGTTAQNWTFHCALMYSQATNVAGDQFGVGVITTAPTSVSSFGTAFTNTGAASPISTGVLTGLASVTPTAVVTFQPGVTTVLGATLDGTVQAAGGGAATLNFYVLNGTAADVIVVKQGSYCEIR